VWFRLILIYCISIYDGNDQSNNPALFITVGAALVGGLMVTPVIQEAEANIS